MNWKTIFLKKKRRNWVNRDILTTGEMRRRWLTEQEYYYNKGFQTLFVTLKPEVSSMVITDSRYVLGLTDERLAEEL